MLCFASVAFGQGSTINPALPRDGQPYSASTIRGQFDAAYDDINALATGGTPHGPCGGDLGGTFPNCTVLHGTHLTGSLASGLTIPTATLTGPAITAGSITGAAISGGTINGTAVAGTTGTGNVVFSASPSLTGILTIDALVGMQLNATATAFAPANQALFMDGTYTGSGLGPYAEFSIADTAANSTVGSALVGLRVDHNINTGAGAGSRTGIQAILTQNAAASGTADNLKYYTAIFGQSYFSHNEGGGSGTEKGNVYGLAGIGQLQSGATFFNSIQGAELDVSVQSGASVKYKSVLTLANVNSDAVKGSSYDAMLGFLSDGTAKFDEGIAFGRPGAGSWPIETATGAVIRVKSGISAGAFYGIDFGDLAIASGGAYIKGATFSIDEVGNLRTSSAVITPGLYLASFADFSTPPTIASGGCTTGSAQSISANNGTAAFTITLGGATCGSTIVLTLPAAAHGWHCTADDITTPASNEVHQTAGGSTTSVTLTNYVRTTGVAGNFTGADVLAISCRGY